VAEGVFRSPLLAGLDARGRADVQAMSRVRHLPEGGLAFAPGDPADTLWFVTSGAIVLETPRGARELGVAEHFGSEALVRGARRTTRARARGPSSLIEVPVVALERILARGGAAALLARESAVARRQALVALLLETPFGQALDEGALEAFVARLREAPLARGTRLFEANEPANAAYVVATGLVELVTAGGDKGYAARGDVLGLEAALGGGAYGSSAAALGDAVVWSLSAAVARELRAREPRAVARAESAARARLEQQRRGALAVRGLGTRHAFHELERLESARSLLAIELDRCVRCGECTRACADTHGTPRLERRGERAVLALARNQDFSPRALLFPHACQHCKDPACLPECPTGAITRDASGAVDLNQDLCTGCGACAKACPWEAIRLAPRVAGEPRGGSAVVATKCDLCRGSSGPACVEACPTGAIFRADPERDLVELGSVLGRERRRRPATPPERGASRLIVVAALVPPCVALAASGGAAPSERHELFTGTLAGLCCLLLVGHGLLKRLAPARAWIVERAKAGKGRGMAPFVRVHLLSGLVAAAAVVAHAGLTPGQGVAGALVLTFWGLALSGGLGAAAYRGLPARLTRLERQGGLPEDRPLELEALEQRLYGSLSAQDRAAKELARRVLLPYARAWHGPLALVASGRSLREEEGALAARVARLLEGRKSERLASSATLVEAAVALRALGARRLLETALGAWLPLHVVLSVLLVVLLVVHAVGALR
jgi:Fe-S-cluster-containing dehydrogenase component